MEHEAMEELHFPFKTFSLFLNFQSAFSFDKKSTLCYIFVSAKIIHVSEGFTI